MAYTHSKYEVQMTPNVDTANAASGSPTTVQGVVIAATGVKAVWAPGLVPHIIRGIGVHQIAGHPNSDPVHLSFRSDISTPGTPTEIIKIVLPTTVTAAGTVIYKMATYIIEVKPGGQVQCAVTAAATAGCQAKVVLYVEPRWEDPSNLTGMLRTT